MEQQLYELPAGWSFKKLGDLFHITSSKRVHKKDWKTEGVPFYRAREIVELSKRGVVDNELFITEGMYEDFSTKFGAPRENDLLITGVGTIGICYVVQEKDRIYFKDGNIIWLKNQQGNIEPRFIEYAFQSHFVNKQVHSATGAVVKTYTIVRAKNTIVPVCPLNEQKRIVARLDALFTRIDAAITHLQETLELSKALFASALDEVFVEGASQWKKAPLSQVAEVARGKSKHRPRNDKSLFDGEYPFIQTGDVRNADKYIQSYSTTYNEKGLAQSKLWSKGTICLTIAANIGEVAILGMDACFPDSVVGISSDTVSNEYIYYFLTTLQQHLDSKANAAAQKNINLRILSEIQIPVPSIEEQLEIAEYLDALAEHTRTLEAETRVRLDQLATLKSSLLDSAFRGQL